MNDQATTTAPTNDLGLSHDQLLEMAYYMRFARALEEKLTALFRQGKVIGGLYRSLGQEGESVGTSYALDFKKGDILSPLIRNMGSMLVAGAKPVEIFMQYMAKANAPTRGRDLNIHMTNLERGYIGPISMLGDMIPVMAGITLASRMQRRNMVGMVYIGDGGTSTGAFHEGVNFAAVQKLPLVVVMEDNGYAYSTPRHKQTAARSLADRASGYGCAGESVDGNDVLATYAAARRAVDRARNGEGVTLLEVKTFRMKGHAEHDNQAYVPAEVLAEWKERDPIEQFEKVLIQEGVAVPGDFDALQQRIRVEIDSAADDAERSPMPRPEDAARGVYHGDGFWEQ